MLVPIITIALNALLVFALGFWTSIQRSTGDKVIYYGATLDPTSGLAKAQRAHGNASEYAGAITALFLLCMWLGTHGPVAGGFMIGITAARYLHAFGFLTCKTLDTPHWAKAIGALTTYIGGIALCIYVIWDAVQSPPQLPVL
ncbi:MAG: MAPEG family protein [Pseudomonadota bacterium]